MKKSKDESNRIIGVSNNNHKYKIVESLSGAIHKAGTLLRPSPPTTTIILLCRWSSENNSGEDQPCTLLGIIVLYYTQQISASLTATP